MPCLPRPSNRQRSSVCMCLYLSRGTGACAGSGVHAARRQPCFWWAVVHFVILCVGEWLVAPCVPHPRLPPPSYRQRSSVHIYMYLPRWSGARASTGAHAARRQPCFWWAVVYSIYFIGGVACRTVCDPCPPPPASMLTAQQRVHFFVFVEGEQGVCGHRGACCTSTTMFFGGQLCVLFFFVWVGGLRHHL